MEEFKNDHEKEYQLKLNILITQQHIFIYPSGLIIFLYYVRHNYIVWTVLAIEAEGKKYNTRSV